jgi:hypothetical protein
LQRLVLTSCSVKNTYNFNITTNNNTITKTEGLGGTISRWAGTVGSFVGGLATGVVAVIAVEQRMGTKRGFFEDAGAFMRKGEPGEKSEGKTSEDSRKYHPLWLEVPTLGQKKNHHFDDSI